ncbi:hypothetical protein Pcinc_034546 [Petrolisthes cinctipes]|uniref:Protein hairless n=1 Tax=Petrolisthes cinctipes TaxID=88211 RepID=A0AAE1C1G1_PETCI|nr:hypothetical protein Pcinc_034546 [Petrolisthes cinctipes]
MSKAAVVITGLEGGPGAEVKGKPGTPIPSGSTKVPTHTLSRPSSTGSDEHKPNVVTTSAATAVGVGNTAGGVGSGPGGGRLTFFKEGKFLLELSHRAEMGAPAGWVPVKSKTYWPPPSSTTTTTTQHPLRHDTPTSQSDDCSSLNSSPWTNEHIRKQSVPGRNKTFVLQQVSFYLCSSPQSSHIRRRIRRRRNPFLNIAEPFVSEKSSENSKVSYYRKIKLECFKKSNEEKKQRLEKWILLFGVKCGIKLETDTSVKSLFEKPAVSAEIVDPTFVSPRKRYLRQMESDQENMHRKKLHSGANSVPHNTGERASSSSTSTLPHNQSNRSAINSQTSSVYSIESILNHGSASRKNDSFLRTLLKPEPKPNNANYRSSSIKERERVNDIQVTPVKMERQERAERGIVDGLDQLGTGHTDNTDTLIDLNRLPAERFDLRPGPMTSLYRLSPYLDPRYMMLQSLAPSLVPTVSPQHTEVAQAFAAAAAAAAGLTTYPLGHLHPSFSATQYPSFLSGGYTPPTSIASQLLRSQPHSSRSSPHPIPHSPSPKPQVPSTPVSPHMSRGASPRGAPSPWQPPPPSLHSLSPHRPLTSPLPSPPPQG